MYSCSVHVHVGYSTYSIYIRWGTCTCRIFHIREKSSVQQSMFYGKISMCPRQYGFYKDNGNDFLCRNKWETLKHVKWRANVIVPTSVDNGWTLQYSVRQLQTAECSGSVVECLTRNRRAVGSSLSGVTALWSLSKTHLSKASLVLVQPRKTRPYITERLLMGRKESNQTNKIKADA